LGLTIKELNMEWDWQHWVALAVWTWVWDKWVSHHLHNLWDGFTGRH
jgi:hypothetical protein